MDEAPDPEMIGNAGWTILHTTAAAYPQHPSPEQQQRMWDFVRTWSHIYPCTHCAAHMRISMKQEPPDVESKETLSLWVCRLHNKVNSKLGKEIFDCTLENVLRRWHPTYPNISDGDQTGGPESLPPNPPTKLRTSDSDDVDSLMARFKTRKTASPAVPQAPMTKKAMQEDPDFKALMDMNCTAFCPKDSKLAEI
eukprot:Sspe_Gene.93412::Locus_66054_Transcript_1_1_Confidence_1.000_Length_888::g.93412::m.93412/K17783/ERV1, GFER, ALR; mitochondrial FAD-linked sulfhydryl oxidase